MLSGVIPSAVCASAASFAPVPPFANRQDSGDRRPGEIVRMCLGNDARNRAAKRRAATAIRNVCRRDRRDPSCNINDVAKGREIVVDRISAVHIIVNGNEPYTRFWEPHFRVQALR